MKRYGNLWNTFCSVENATQAIINGTEHKRGDIIVCRRLGYPDREGLDPGKVRKEAERLVELVRNGWTASALREMIVRPPRGKERRILSPTLTDHFVQWMLIQAIKPCLMRGMYAHSYGSIPGRGTEGARKTVEQWVRRDKRAKYFVKLDIRKFYENVDQDVLREQFRRVVKDSKMLKIIDRATAMTLKGLPIGAYASQWFGNFYLQPLDHFILQQCYKTRRGKRIPYVSHYLRYMDDMLLIGRSKRDLERAARLVIAYCEGVLQLRIKPCWEIMKIAKDRKEVREGSYVVARPAPIDICGYRFYRDHTEVRGSIFLHTSRMAAKTGKILRDRGYVFVHRAESVLSLCGWFSHADNERFLSDYVERRIDTNLLKEVKSHADKHGIVGDAARVFCAPRGRYGRHQVLYGCSGRVVRGAGRRDRNALFGDGMDDAHPVAGRS